MLSVTNRRCNISLSAAAAAAIVTSCLRGSKWRGEAGGQASQRYGAGYRHVCSCCLARKMKTKRKSAGGTKVPTLKDVAKKRQHINSKKEQQRRQR